MDETTKVLIGTLSGFLIAFLVEPAKPYFQNREKLKNLRLALYKELIHNFRYFEPFLQAGIEKDLDRQFRYFKTLGLYVIRDECYKQAISSQLDLFYQLAEANELNDVYSRLSIARDSIAKEAVTARERKQRAIDAELAFVCRYFVMSVANGFGVGKFDKGILEHIVDREKYLEILHSATAAKKKRSVGVLVS